MEYLSPYRVVYCHISDKEMPPDKRAWMFPRCGTHHDRPINAARNILAIRVSEVAR